MSAPEAEEDDLAVVEAPFGSDLYRRALGLREAILRKPLGLELTAEELADDQLRRHFCATSHGAVVGSVSLRPLETGTIQLRQMAVAEDRRRERFKGKPVVLYFYPKDDTSGCTAEACAFRDALPDFSAGLN